jgi:hypothetical protein
MLGQMCWLPAFGSNGQKILYLRTNPNNPWQPYTAFPQYKFPTTIFLKVLKDGQPTKN